MTDSIVSEQRDFWDDFNHRMSPKQADRLLKVHDNTVMAAIRRGEIVPLRCPGSKRVFVTPNILADWVRDYWHQPA